MVHSQDLRHVSAASASSALHHSNDLAWSGRWILSVVLKSPISLLHGLAVSQGLAFSSSNGFSLRHSFEFFVIIRSSTIALCSHKAVQFSRVDVEDYLTRWHTAILNRRFSVLDCVRTRCRLPRGDSGVCCLRLADDPVGDNTTSLSMRSGVLLVPCRRKAPPPHPS